MQPGEKAGFAMTLEATFAGDVGDFNSSAYQAYLSAALGVSASRGLGVNFVAMPRRARMALGVLCSLELRAQLGRQRAEGLPELAVGVDHIPRRAACDRNPVVGLERLDVETPLRDRQAVNLHRRALHLLRVGSLVQGWIEGEVAAPELEAKAIAAALRVGLLE